MAAAGIMGIIINWIDEYKIEQYGLEYWNADKHISGQIPGFANGGAARNIADMEYQKINTSLPHPS